MSVDLRTRRDGHRPSLTPDQILDEVLPLAFAAQAERLAEGAAHLAPRPLVVEVGERTVVCSVDTTHHTIRVEGTDRVPPGPHTRVRLTEDQLVDVVEDQATPMGLFSSGRLDLVEGGLDELQDWWVLWRGALDGRAPHTPGAIELRDRDGSPLDLTRSFTLDDDDAALAHFLTEAGFLHLRGVFSEEQMAQIASDMDRAAPTYAPGDHDSWWARTADGADRLVRMRHFDRHSPTTAALLDGPEFARLCALTGDGHRVAPTTRSGNRIEALVKPIGVVEGISDVPWHKDCSLGRHSYDCCAMTVGISVTGADAEAGQLRMVAGSHRALVWPALLRSDLDLPVVDVPTETGDVTTHLSCCLHMAQPPVTRERRVLYTQFGLPAFDAEASAEGRERLDRMRQAAPVTVSQEPGVVS